MFFSNLSFTQCLGTGQKVPRKAEQPLGEEAQREASYDQSHMPPLGRLVLSSGCPVRFSHLSKVHHLWFSHRECTRSIHHEEESLASHRSATEITGVQFLRKQSFSQETGELFSSGKEKTHYNHGREAVTTPATLSKGVQSITEAVVMSKTMVLYLRTRSNEAEEMKDREQRQQSYILMNRILCKGRRKAVSVKTELPLIAKS